MTSTLPANALAGTPVGTDRKSPLATTSGMEQPLFFVQLLSQMLGLDVAQGESHLAADSAAPAAPDEQEPPTAVELAQMAVCQGFPALVETPPLLPIPVAKAATAQDSSSRAPAGLPAPPTTGSPLSPIPRQPLAGEASPVPQSPVVDAAEASSSCQPIALPTSSTTLSAHELFFALHESLVESPAQPRQETPRPTDAYPVAAEMRKLLERGSEKAEVPVEVSPTLAGTSPSATSMLVQEGRAGSTRDNHAEQPQGAQFASAVHVRSRARLSGAGDGDSVLSPLSSEANALHITPNVHTTAATQPTREPSAPLEVSPAEVVRQVAQQLEEVTRAQSGSSVTLQLEPEHLGRLRVTISMVDDAIHTRIVVTNPTVRHMLESHSSLLQQALQERGLQLGALQVSVQGEGRQFQMHHAYAVPSSNRGWLQAEEAAPAVGEGSFWHPRTGGINLLA